MTGFNGAATLSLRKSGRRRQYYASADSASMGPQLYRCGNYKFLTVAPANNKKLQWGRNFIVAEMAPPGPGSARLLWLQWGATLSLRKYGLSPQLCIDHIKLQWGRNFIVAEIWTMPAGVLMCWSLLQWGRNFIVAEIHVPVLVAPRASCSFNGAATLSLRK